MSTLTTYLIHNPLALAAIAIVSTSTAWQIVLWLKARSSIRAARVTPRSHQGLLGKKQTSSSRDRQDSPDDDNAISRALRNAGIPLGAPLWTSLRIGCALLAILIGLVTHMVFVGIAVAAITLVGTHLWLSNREQKAAASIERQVLQLEIQMAENSRAGLSVERSLKSCLDYAEQPIKGHLERIVSELSYSNRTLSEAFASFAERSGSQDVAILSSVISVQQETGANLADTLDFLSQTVEEKQRMRLTLRSRIAEMKLTKTIVALTPLIIVAICSLCIKGTASFYFENPLGWMVLGACAAMDILGILILNKMSDIPID